MSVTQHFAIVGAGLVGRLMAWRLAEAGQQVTLFDKDPLEASQSAGMIAAAMLAPATEVIDAEPVVYHQGAAGIQIWRSWVDQLNATTQTKIELQYNGSVVVSHRQDSGDFQKLLARLHAHDDLSTHNVVPLNQAQLCELEPELADQFDRGCFLVDEGCIDNHALYKAMAERLRQLDVTIEQREIPTLITNTLPEELAAFDQMIDCRGFGARQDVRRLRGVRGEVIRVHAPEVHLSRPVRLVHPRYKLYIAPKPDHEYVIGATQIESESEASVTVRSSLELLSALYSVHRGFAEAHILEQTARCRPAFDDNLPRIDMHPRLMSINGLYRHGYLLSPSVVEQALSELGVSSANPWPDIVCRQQATPSSSETLQVLHD
ncbi:tRNA 5-methylaminomethyl-2-thiouridine biosynthesis bifunctional protein MnmC [BD1-7 clade bacterium]|uniref:D-amino-acid oxidase n=1 Tax=BD1-7 clade bacterium TaxID=2029982 RepID=A0A5S9Q7Y2_9GAMM|nr:tRNA 5-methylaminomethyl-2-thiouridine biosynthesis bifunctional protein MnmC [BD1-7 clade bacterium]